MVLLIHFSYGGIYLRDWDGTFKPCFPVFGNYRCDWPGKPDFFLLSPSLAPLNLDHVLLERKAVTLTLDGNQVNFPCSTCMCPKNALRDLDTTYALRTPELMSFLLEKYRSHLGQNRSKAEGKKLFLDRASIKPFHVRASPSFHFKMLTSAKNNSDSSQFRMYFGIFLVAIFTCKWYQTFCTSCFLERFRELLTTFLSILNQERWERQKKLQKNSMIFFDRIHLSLESRFICIVSYFPHFW